MVYYKNMICRKTSKYLAQLTSPKYFQKSGKCVGMGSFFSTSTVRYRIMGMSLLEVLIGMTILGFAIGPLFMLFQQASKSLNDDGKMIQALFLSEKILTEIKAGVNRNSKFLYNVPFSRQFQIIKKQHISRFEKTVPEFLQNIHGYGKAIDSESLFYDQYKDFWIDIQNEAVGKKQYLITVNTTWKEKETIKNVNLSGLVELIPNKFIEHVR